MEVKSINWLSVAAAEAEVEITDGKFICRAFSCPCEVQVNDRLVEPLHIFDIKKATLVCDTEVGIWNVNDTGLGRKVIAELVDPSAQTLRVGGIKLIVDEYLPSGLDQGDLIQLECARIDLW